jgi:hypothetical protein
VAEGRESLLSHRWRLEQEAHALWAFTRSGEGEQRILCTNEASEHFRPVVRRASNCRIARDLREEVTFRDPGATRAALAPSLDLKPSQPVECLGSWELLVSGPFSLAPGHRLAAPSVFANRPLEGRVQWQRRHEALLEPRAARRLLDRAATTTTTSLRRLAPRRDKLSTAIAKNGS